MSVAARASTMSWDHLPAVLSEQNIADLLGVTVERVRKWSYNGRGPQTFKVGNDRLVRRAAFLNWLAARARRLQ